MDIRNIHKLEAKLRRRESVMEELSTLKLMTNRIESVSVDMFINYNDNAPKLQLRQSLGHRRVINDFIQTYQEALRTELQDINITLKEVESALDAVLGRGVN